MQILSKWPRGRFCRRPQSPINWFTTAGEGGLHILLLLLLLLLRNPSTATVEQQRLFHSDFRVIIIVFLFYLFLNPLLIRCRYTAITQYQRNKMNEILRIMFLHHTEWISIALATNHRTASIVYITLWRRTLIAYICTDSSGFVVFHSLIPSIFGECL